jgi:hypothetical protein
MTGEAPKQKSRRVAFFGIILICLGVVFLRSGRLGVIFMMAGAIFVIIGLVKRSQKT